MSHAANIRSRQRSLQDTSPTKRRKLSLEHDGLSSSHRNGLLNGNGPLITAVPTTNIRNPKKPAVETPAAHIGTANGEHGEESNGVSEEEEDEQDLDTDAEDSEDDTQGSTNNAAELPNGTAEEPIDKAGQSAVTEMPTPNSDLEDSDGEEQSFGDLLRARAPEPIDVEASFLDPTLHTTSLAPNSSQALTMPTATSLGTVLTQALRTNDPELLESCFHVPNLESIRATIERLHSSLAVQLLQKLAERMHKRPGRAGSLMVWVQWTVVAHGGYLAGQPEAMKHLRTLYKVVKQRASGLQPLLALKGKLDMLEAQMQMRRNMQAAAKADEEEEDIDDDIVYIEGQDSDDDSVADGDDEGDNPDSQPRRKQRGTGDLSNRSVNGVPGDADTDSYMNGIGGDAENDAVDDDEEDSDEEHGCIDDEASESDIDSEEDLSEDIDYDDVDVENDEESDSDGEDLRPAKRLAQQSKPASRR